MRYGEKCRLLKAEWDGYSDGLCGPCAPFAPGPSHGFSFRREQRTPFRKPLQFIVIVVMNVISGTFPYTYRVST
jgi:hypothetical protein